MGLQSLVLGFHVKLAYINKHYYLLVFKEGLWESCLKDQTLLPPVIVFFFFFYLDDFFLYVLSFPFLFIVLNEQVQDSHYISKLVII